MLNAFANLLCSKLCRHNWRKPIDSPTTVRPSPRPRLPRPHAPHRIKSSHNFYISNSFTKYIKYLAQLTVSTCSEAYSEACSAVHGIYDSYK